MGDRVSLQFVDKWEDYSPYLYSHWAGMDLVNAATMFVLTIRDDESAGDALAQFIKSKFAVRFDDLHVEFEDDGDNDDNGNHTVNIESKQSSLAPTNKKHTIDEIKEAKRKASNLIANTMQKLDFMQKELKKEYDVFVKEN